MDIAKERDPFPEFETLDDIAKFWDTHSTADYADLTHAVQFQVRYGRVIFLHLARNQVNAAQIDGFGKTESGTDRYPQSSGDAVEIAQ